MLRERSPERGSFVIALNSGFRSWPIRSAAASTTGTVEGSVRRTRLAVSVADAVRVLEPQLERVDAERVGDPVHLRSQTANDTDVTPNPRIAVVGVRFV